MSSLDSERVDNNLQGLNFEKGKNIFDVYLAVHQMTMNFQRTGYKGTKWLNGDNLSDEVILTFRQNSDLLPDGFKLSFSKDRGQEAICGTGKVDAFADQNIREFKAEQGYCEEDVNTPKTACGFSQFALDKNIRRMDLTRISSLVLESMPYIRYSCKDKPDLLKKYNDLFSEVSGLRLAGQDDKVGDPLHFENDYLSVEEKFKKLTRELYQLDDEVDVINHSKEEKARFEERKRVTEKEAAKRDEKERAEKEILEAIEQIAFYIINHHTNKFVDQKISNIYSILKGHESLDSKLQKLESENSFMNLIVEQNKRTKEMAAKEVVDALKIEVDAYIEKKRNKPLAEEKLNVAKKMQEILYFEDISSISKLEKIKSALGKSDAFLNHRSRLKRNAENFFGRVATLLDGFFKKPTVNQNVPQPCEKSKYAPFMFFAPPDSAKLVTNMLQKLDGFDLRVSVTPMSA